MVYSLVFPMLCFQDHPSFLKQHFFNLPNCSLWPLISWESVLKLDFVVFVCVFLFINCYLEFLLKKNDWIVLTEICFPLPFGYSHSFFFVNVIQFEPVFKKLLHHHHSPFNMIVDMHKKRGLYFFFFFDKISKKCLAGRVAVVKMMHHNTSVLCSTILSIVVGFLFCIAP